MTENIQLQKENLWAETIAHKFQASSLYPRLKNSSEIVLQLQELAISASLGVDGKVSEIVSSDRYKARSRQFENQAIKIIKEIFPAKDTPAEVLTGKKKILFVFSQEREMGMQVRIIAPNAKIGEQAPDITTESLIGTKWKISQSSGRDFTVTLLDEQRLQVENEKLRPAPTWEFDGSQIELSFNNGLQIYKGRLINLGSMQGTAKGWHDATEWNWTGSQVITKHD